MNIYKGRRFDKEIIMTCVRWYLAYSLSCRDLEEIMKERGLKVDHSTINRWVVTYSEEFEKRFRKRNKRPVGNSWRMDETYIKIKGNWHYQYRAVDKEGFTIDFYFSENRDEEAATAFFDKAIASSGIPVKVHIDKSGVNTAALKWINKRHQTKNSEEDDPDKIEIRQCKYLNNRVEQDHRGIKRITKPMMGFGSFNSARATLAGIELNRMLKKGQAKNLKSKKVWEQFYEIAS